MKGAAAMPWPEGDAELLLRIRKRLAEDFQILASLHDREPDTGLFTRLKAMNFPDSLTLRMEDGPRRDTLLLARSALESLPQPLDEAWLDELAADYAAIYLNHEIGASPEESVWLDEDNLICQEAMFQVRQWYRSHGLGVANWRLRPDDHLVYQLQFIAFLLARDEAGSLEKAATFMDEHLLRWIGNFGERVLHRAATPWFSAAAALTAAYVEETRDLLAEILGRPRPSPEEIEERMKPARPEEERPVAFVPGPPV